MMKRLAKALTTLLLSTLLTQALILALAHGPAHGEEQAKELAQKKSAVSVSLEYELDPYYSNIGLYISLTGEGTRTVGDMDEFRIYKGLLLSSFVPRFIVIEFALFPMPVAGLLIKSNAEGFHDDAQVADDLNLVQAVTAGFEEPYALSFFIGDVIRFTSEGEEWKEGNFGYKGLLLSVGDQHIKDNELIDDNWAEMEIKIKGDRSFKTHKHHWSFRVGAKLHGHTGIRDVLYLGLRRSRTDFDASVLSIMKNSGFAYRFDMDKETFEPVSHSLVIDKKWPVKGRRFAFKLEVGVIWEGARKYTGSLDEGSDRDELQFVFRPNVVF